MSIYTWVLFGMLAIIAVALIYVFLESLIDSIKKWLGLKKDINTQDNMNKHASISQLQEVLQTKDLVIRTLRAIGCEPSVNEGDENRIDFQYQGGNFFIITADGYVFTYLYFVWWYDAPLDNIDALSAIQKAVNNANCQPIGCNVMYTINKEDRIVGVHSRSQILFSPDIRGLDRYLTTELQELFEVRNNVVMEIRTEIGE